ncbi:MAG: PD-(D/E)XK nuclease family protein [Oligoflexia bacterium]|nr:PD-(D/E)XK nuclease family protein [Oligoflexia bacterium]
MSLITLSSSGGSGNSVATLLNCGRQYYLRYHEKFREKTINQNLFFGSIVHDTLLIKHLEQRSTSQVVEDYIRSEIAFKFASTMQGKYILELSTSEEELVSKAIKMYQAFSEIPINPISIEGKFEVLLTDPVSGVVNNNVIVNGRIDIIEQVKITEKYENNRLIIEEDSNGKNSIVITDLKTSSAKLNSLNGHFFQLLFYAYIYFIKHQKMPDYLCIRNVVKTKIPSVQTIFYKPSFKEIISTYTTIKDCADKISRGEFQENYVNCRSRYNTNCPYEAICHSELFDLPELEIEQKLIKED